MSGALDAEDGEGNSAICDGHAANRLKTSRYALPSSGMFADFRQDFLAEQIHAVVPFVEAEAQIEDDMVDPDLQVPFYISHDVVRAADHEGAL